MMVATTSAAVVVVVAVAAAAVVVLFSRRPSSPSLPLMTAPLRPSRRHARQDAPYSRRRPRNRCATVPTALYPQPRKHRRSHIRSTLATLSQYGVSRATVLSAQSRIDHNPTRWRDIAVRSRIELPSSSSLPIGRSGQVAHGSAFCFTFLEIVFSFSMYICIQDWKVTL